MTSVITSLSAFLLPNFCWCLFICCLYSSLFSLFLWFYCFLLSLNHHNSSVVPGGCRGNACACCPPCLSDVHCQCCLNTLWKLYQFITPNLCTYIPFFQMAYLPIVQKSNLCIPTSLLLHFIFLKNKTYVWPVFVSCIQCLAQKQLQEKSWAKKTTISALQLTSSLLYSASKTLYITLNSSLTLFLALIP